MSAISREAARLLRSQRWAALATLDARLPLASMVAYASASDGSLLFFLSQLAQHTRNLVEHPHAALAISEPDVHESDPQLLRRVTVRGAATEIRRDADGFEDAAARYLERFPDAGPRFGLGDFLLFRFVPEEVRYVGGFARAARFTWAEILEAERER